MPDLRRHRLRQLLTVRRMTPDPPIVMVPGSALKVTWDGRDPNADPLEWDVVIGPQSAGHLVTGPGITGARCRLHLPYDRPPASLVGNSRLHWRRRSADTRQVRSDVLTLARSVNLHRLAKPVEHVTVTLTWAPGDRRRRDADNLWPLLKACCDSLARGRKDWVGLDLVPDDTPKWMDKRAPVIAPPPTPAGMWLDLQLRFRKDAA